MAKQEATEQQQKLAKSNAEKCEQSLKQKLEQEATQKLIEAKEQLDKMSQKLAQLPEKAIGQLNKAIYKLLNIINGHINNVSKKFNAEAVIAELEKLLNPVIKALSSLPIPEIPGLKQISKLLAALKSLIASTKDGKDAQLDVKVEIPPAVINALTDLLSAIQSLCTTLPVVLINLVFQMLNCIIGLFNQIAGILGVPSIPFPLNLVPQCINMMPDIMDFVLSVPTKLNNALQGTLKKVFGKISQLQCPQMPDMTQKPKLLPRCPTHDPKPAVDEDEQNESDSDETTSEDSAQDEMDDGFGI